MADSSLSKDEMLLFKLKTDQTGWNLVLLYS